MKKFAIICTLLLLTSTAYAQTAGGNKLIDLIPSLYGGDGISLATAPTASHTAHFSIASLAGINRLNQQIAAEIGGFPFSSSVGGFTFDFDPVLGDFVTTTKSLGPLIAERAATLGRNKLNTSLSYTYLSYNKFGGQSLGDFEVDALHDTHIIGFPDTHEQFEHDIVEIEMDLDIKVQILAFSATYGLLDRLDIGFLIPLAFVDMDVKSTASVEQADENTLFDNIHTFAGGPESPEDRVSKSATGIGDIVLRAKYHLPDNSLFDWSIATLAQFSTGDHEDFLGTGDTTIQPFLVLSKTLSNNITPHINIGYEFNLDRDALSALEYTIGFDYGRDKWTLAGEYISSNELDGDGIGDDILETAWGIKWNPKERFLVSLNTQFALNDAGLRSTFVTTLGFEYSF